MTNPQVSGLQPVRHRTRRGRGRVGVGPERPRPDRSPSRGSRRLLRRRAGPRRGTCARGGAGPPGRAGSPARSAAASGSVTLTLLTEAPPSPDRPPGRVAAVDQADGHQGVHDAGSPPGRSPRAARPWRRASVRASSACGSPLPNSASLAACTAAVAASAPCTSVVTSAGQRPLRRPPERLLAHLPLQLVDLLPGPVGEDLEQSTTEASSTLSQYW